MDWKHRRRVLRVVREKERNNMQEMAASTKTPAKARRRK